MHEMNQSGSKGGAVAGGAGALLGEVATTFRVKGAVLKAVGRGDVPLVRGYGALRRAENALSGARERLAAQERMAGVTV
jgi:hypothetical protein